MGGVDGGGRGGERWRDPARRGEGNSEKDEERRLDEWGKWVPCAAGPRLVHVAGPYVGPTGMIAAQYKTTGLMKLTYKQQVIRNNTHKSYF